MSPHSQERSAYIDGNRERERERAADPDEVAASLGWGRQRRSCRAHRPGNGRREVNWQAVSSGEQEKRTSRLWSSRLLTG
jgi:hypothetical protein